MEHAIRPAAADRFSLSRDMLVLLRGGNTVSASRPVGAPQAVFRRLRDLERLFDESREPLDRDSAFVRSCFARWKAQSSEAPGAVSFAALGVWPDEQAGRVAYWGAREEPAGAASPGVMLWLARADGHPTAFCERWLSFRGQTEEAERRLAWRDRLHEGDLERWLELSASALVKREAWEAAVRLRSGAGRHVPVVLSGAPIFAADGSFEGFVGACCPEEAAG